MCELAPPEVLLLLKPMALEDGRAVVLLRLTLPPLPFEEG
jgi:hypothetical protein